MKSIKKRVYTIHTSPSLAITQLVYDLANKKSKRRGRGGTKIAKILSLSLLTVQNIATRILPSLAYGGVLQSLCYAMLDTLISLAMFGRIP